MRIIWAFLPVKRFMADTENICYVDARTGAQEFRYIEIFLKIWYHLKNMIQPTLFDIEENHTVESISNPKTYKGIYAFHKYWGKKPIESLDYCIENCTNKNDIVLDPFLGSGIISKEAHNLGRRFLGIDINPFSIEHTLFLLSLPSADDYKNAIKLIKENVLSKISESYALENGDTATHFLWNKDYLQKVWTKNCSSRKKIQ